MPNVEVQVLYRDHRKRLTKESLMEFIKEIQTNQNIYFLKQFYHNFNVSTFRSFWAFIAG